MRCQHAVRSILCALCLALALPAAAVAGWSTPESVSTGAPSPLVLAANGTGLVFRYSATNEPTVAERPPGGPLGTPYVLTGTIGQNDYPILAVDAAGNALIASHDDRQVAYRPAGGPVSSPQNLAAGKYPALLSMAASGEAMMGLNPTPSGAVEVAFRPAGSLTTFDMVNAESFAASGGVIVGLQLQADGGAVVVWLDVNTNKLWQSERPAGGGSFDTPTEIPIPAGADTRKFGVRFDSDPSGWAMVAWQASSIPGGSYDEAMASVRAPGGAFPAAQVVGLDNNQMANATPAVTASGEGVVAWRHTDSTAPAGCFAPGSVMAAMQHQGTWAAPAALTEGAYPDISISAFPNTAISAGNDLVVPFVAIHKDPCGGGSETRALRFRHFRSGASGLTDQGTTELLAPFAGFPLISDMAMEPGGRILVSYNKSGGLLSDFDGVTPGTGSTPTPTPTPTPGAGPPSGSTTPPGSGTPTPPKIAAIIPRHFVTIAPIDPAALELKMTCPPDETCAARAWAYYLLTGKPPPWAHEGHATKTRRILIATGTRSLPAGAKGKLKLKPTKLGRKALRRGLKLKIQLKLTVTTATKRGTSSYKTTIKARKKKHR